MRHKPPQLDKPISGKRALSDEEKQLWKNVVEEGFVIEPRKKIIREPEHKLKPEKNAVLPKTPETKTGRVEKGSIEARLDLHGYTLSSAYNALRDFITRSHARGIKMTLVITGKGRAGESGTLRAQLPRWLAENDLKQYIISCETAEQKHGGEGAWYVRIRKKKLA